MPSREIVVASFPHPGHLFPAVELANQLAARNYETTLLFPSSTPTSSVSIHPLVRVELYSLPDSIDFDRNVFGESVVGLIDRCFGERDADSRPLCAVVDEMAGWIADVFHENYGIPAVSLFTSSATSAALEHAMQQVSADGMVTPGTVLTVPGLPEEMALTPSMFASRRGPPPDGGPSGRGGRGPPPRGGPGGRGRGPPPRGGPGGRGPPPRRSIASTGRAIALLFNTCEDLERPFIEYLRKEAGKPVWGVGPLVRSKSGGDVSGSEVIEWLDSKPRGSVVYVSFGSLVNPSDDELAELAAGLEQSNRDFVWVVQSGSRRHGPDGGPTFSPDDVAARVGPRGLIVRGWAPQVAILDHPATGGYVCHCGWNSTVEALGSGVPMLTWPVRGDQFLNARLVTGLLRVGLPLKEADVEVRRDDVARGIERLMGDADIKKRAEEVKSIFAGGFPASSAGSLDRFVEFVSEYRQQTK